MADIKHKNISTRSGQLLAYFGEKNTPCFSSEDVKKLFPGTEPVNIRVLLSSMVKRGLLMRLKDGVYYIIPYEQDSNTFMPDWHLLAQYLVGDAKYYIGYYSAMQVHSLITQPALKEQIVVNKQIKPAVLKIRNISFQFIYHNDKHFFGAKKTWVDSHNKVMCADLEKTFVDALFKPEYAGGITEIAKAIYKSREQIDFNKLLDYINDFDSLAVTKRMGYLLELLEIQSLVIAKLQKMKTNSYFLLEPSHPKQGKSVSHWNIQENIDKQSILSPIFT